MRRHDNHWLGDCDHNRAPATDASDALSNSRRQAVHLSVASGLKCVSATMGGLSVARVKPATASAATVRRVGLLEYFLRTVVQNKHGHTHNGSQPTGRKGEAASSARTGRGSTTWAEVLLDCCQLLSRLFGLPDSC